MFTFWLLQTFVTAAPIFSSPTIHFPFHQTSDYNSSNTTYFLHNFCPSPSEIWANSILFQIFFFVSRISFLLTILLESDALFTSAFALSEKGKLSQMSYCAIQVLCKSANCSSILIIIINWDRGRRYAPSCPPRGSLPASQVPHLTCFWTWTWTFGLPRASGLGNLTTYQPTLGHLFHFHSAKTRVVETDSRSR